MATLSNRILLIASYCLMSINMAIEVLNHPDAKDHMGSIVGLAFVVATLIALVWKVPPRLLTGVRTLNIILAIGGTYLIGHYLYSHGTTWAEAPELLVRVYLVVVVPIVAVLYFITLAGAKQGT